MISINLTNEKESQGFGSNFYTSIKRIHKTHWNKD